MEEVSNEKTKKYSLVTGEKIKKKRVSKLKKEHKKKTKEALHEEKKFSKRKKKVDKKLNKQSVTIESKTISGDASSLVNEEAVKELSATVVKEEPRREVLVVRKTEKGKPVTKKRKFMNLLSYALVGFVAIFFGYISGNFYVANYLNKVDYGAFSEESLKDDAKSVYELVYSRNIMDSTAGELFVASEYVLNNQESYYATTNGAIQPSIGSKQDIWGYKKKTGNIFECESASKGMLALAEKYFYDSVSKKATIFKASKVGDKTTSYPENPTWEMELDAYKEEYGTSPDAPAIPYIISS
ncbi:MAG: hypothetical protein IJD48_02185, partial [Clostridia bacterium]|nr:hypothetical protein [Clostridia bacterium]